MSDQNNERNSSIPRGYKQEDTDARKEWVKQFSGVEIDYTKRDKAEDLQGIIENHVGFMQVPMSVVGPLSLDGTYAQGEFCIPLCTLEGTLAMSMNRGIYAANVSGGTVVRHFRQELSRAPVFIFDNRVSFILFLSKSIPSPVKADIKIKSLTLVKFSFKFEGALSILFITSIIGGPSKLSGLIFN